MHRLLVCVAVILWTVAGRASTTLTRAPSTDTVAQAITDTRQRVSLTQEESQSQHILSATVSYALSQSRNRHGSRTLALTLSPALNSSTQSTSNSASRSLSNTTHISMSLNHDSRSLSRSLPSTATRNASSVTFSASLTLRVSETRRLNSSSWTATPSSSRHHNSSSGAVSGTASTTLSLPVTQSPKPTASSTDICVSAFGNRTTCLSSSLCDWCPVLEYCVVKGNPCASHCYEIDMTYHPSCSALCVPCESVAMGPYCAASCNCFELDPLVRDECSEDVAISSRGMCVFCQRFGYCAPYTNGQCSCSMILNETACLVAFGGSCTYSASDGCLDGPCFSFLIRGFTAQPYFLFAVAVVKDVVALMVVNAVGPIFARWIAKLRRKMPLSFYRDFPMVEITLEESGAYYFELAEGSITDGVDSETGSAMMDHLLVSRASNSLSGSNNTRRKYGSNSASEAAGTSRRLMMDTRSGVKNLARHMSGLNGSELFSVHSENTQHDDDADDEEEAERSEGSESAVADYDDDEEGRTLKAPKGKSILRSTRSEIAEMTHEEYCRNILLPFLFVVESNDSEDELEAQSRRLLAIMLSNDVWIDVFLFPDNQTIPKHSFDDMETVVRYYATQTVIIFTSSSVKGRVGHTLDTFIGPMILAVLCASDLMGWCLYVYETLSSYTDYLTGPDMFQLVVFRMVNSGSVTAMSLVLVKYVMCWRIARTRGTLPPVASATRARFRFSRKIHVITALYILLGSPMLCVGMGGMVLYPMIPVCLCTVVWVVATKLSPWLDAKLAVHLPRYLRRPENVKLVRVLSRFVFEQQTPALALAISLQACANYLLLFTHRDMYELSYGSVIEKEFLSRSIACFSEQIREDFEAFVSRSAQLYQWLTALVPGA